LNIPIASVVTIGGVAALAIGFAAQSIVKDVLGGLLVLLEDQYVVGDYVLIGEYNGLVEHLTLRMLQVRDSSGRLITIPHSSVTQVVNASRGWSRVDYRVPVGPGVDPDKALGILKATIESIHKEETWSHAILVPIEWMGVETIGQSGIVLRASIRTAPLRQFELRRYINKCVLQAFAAEGVPLGIDPQGMFVPTPTQSADPT
jgi:small conductance mechanosensitive channel